MVTPRRVRLIGFTHAVGLCWVLAACVRHADIRDEPDAAFLAPTPHLDAGDIEPLDSGLETDAYPACGDRLVGACKGPIDFPCRFETWVNETAASCQKTTGCKTNGWLEVTMAADGCVEEIGMDQPNEAMVACLVAELGSVRCNCGEGNVQYLFGFDNTGPCP